MRKQTKTALAQAMVEKDVENAYRSEISHHRPGAEWTSPYGTDGVTTWDAPSTVRLLLEAKYDQDLKAKMPVCSVLGQMLLYLKKFEQAGEVLPNVLFVGDKNECFVLATDSVRGFLNLDLDWSVAPSKGSPELTRALVQGFNLLPYVYDVDSKLDFAEVLEKVETLAQGARHQARATTTNLGAIFLYWRDRVFAGKGSAALTPTEQVDVYLRCLFQPADVYPHPTKRGVLVVPGYPEGVVVNTDAYRSFFEHFAQGYKPSEIEAFYSMKDQLVEDDARRRQGAFFTPRLWVDEAHKEIEKVLGPNWRKECVVWDPASGTANLTRDYNDWGCLISSTAERPDVQVMAEHGWGGDVFQYDFLNPGSWSPFLEDGEKNLIPDHVEDTLYAASKAGKRIVFFMNPPYGTAGDARAKGTSKMGIADTIINTEMKQAKLGACSQQLYAQFMFRCTEIAREYGFKNLTVAVYSKPTFMSSGSYRPFRDWWYKQYAYQSGFMFQASHFADVSGAWGISFTIWNSGVATHTDKASTLPIVLKDVRDFDVVSDSTKAIYNADGHEASEWVRAPIRGLGIWDGPQMKSGLCLRNDGGIAVGSLGHLFYMRSSGNNLMESGTQTCLVSGLYAAAHGFSATRCNWRRVVALYSARKLVAGNWMNDKDEYLAPQNPHPHPAPVFMAPNEIIVDLATGEEQAYKDLPGEPYPSEHEKWEEDYKQWVDDCHVYALLHTSNNCTAMRDVQYKGKTWRIKNHWFWKTRAETLAALDTSDTLSLYKDCKAEQEDAYFATLLSDGKVRLSEEAQRVFTALNHLWEISLPVRESYAAGKPELHLLAHDAGVYQLKHLWRDMFPAEWKALQAEFTALGNRLRDGVYDYGFLKR